MKKLGLVFAASLLASPLALAEVVVNNNPFGPDSISAKQVRGLHLNRSKALPTGQRRQPFELPERSAPRDECHDQVAGRNDAKLKAFWSQQLFTGRGQPPAEAGSASGMKTQVAPTPGAIGYIDSADLDDSVKVILPP